MQVFTLSGKLKLGDTWAFVSWALQQEDVAVTEDARFGQRRGVVRPLLMEIAGLLATSASLRFVPGRGGGRPRGQECVEHEYLPTRRTWTPNESRTICVQLDGRYMSHRKNPSPSEQASLIEGLKSAGFAIAHVGLPLSLEDSIDALGGCYCFVGVDSGMMHVANSVRCPRILLRNRMRGIDATYRGKALMIVPNAEAALNLLVPEQGAVVPSLPVSLSSESTV
jgi:hypothetical protein